MGMGVDPSEIVIHFMGQAHMKWLYIPPQYNSVALHPNEIVVHFMGQV